MALSDKVEIKKEVALKFHTTKKYWYCYIFKKVLTIKREWSSEWFSIECEFTLKCLQLLIIFSNVHAKSIIFSALFHFDQSFFNSHETECWSWYQSHILLFQLLHYNWSDKMEINKIDLMPNTNLGNFSAPPKNKHHD